MIVQELINLIGFRVDRSSLTGAQAQAQTAANAMRNTMLKTFGLLGGVAGLGMIAKSIVDTTIEVEQLGTSFEVMLGSASKSQKLVADLRKMGATTPLEFTDLANGAKALLNFGATGGDTLGTLRQLGDAAGGNAEKMSLLTMAYGQAVQKGKLQGDDWRQMINVGFNPLEEIAKRTGWTMESMAKRMEKGQISAKMLTQALADATGPGGKYFQMMDKQARTLGGLLSTLKDDVKGVMLTIGTALAPTLKKLTTILSGFSSGALKSFSESFAAALGPMMALTGTVLKLVLTFASVLMGTLNPSLQVTGDSLEALAVSFENWAAMNAVSIVNFFQTISGAINLMYLWGVAIWQSIAEVVGWLGVLKDNAAKTVFVMTILFGPALYAAIMAMSSAILFNVQYFALWVAEQAFATAGASAFIGKLVITIQLLWAETAAAWASASGFTAVSLALKAAAGGMGAFLLASLPLIMVAAAAASVTWAFFQIKEALDEVAEAKERDIWLSQEQARADLMLALSLNKNKLKALENAGKGESYAANQLRQTIATDSEALTKMEKKVSKTRAAQNGMVTGEMNQQFEDMLRKQNAAVTDAQAKAKAEVAKQVNIGGTSIAVDASGMAGGAGAGKKIGDAIAAAFSIELRKVLIATA